jgi:DNA-directed RNA polymerase specialized sigma54-like protein
VQALDLLGIGARDVQECLSLQLPALEKIGAAGAGDDDRGEHLSALAARAMSPGCGWLLGAPPPDRHLRRYLQALDPRPAGD